MRIRSGSENGSNKHRSLLSKKSSSDFSDDHDKVIHDPGKIIPHTPWVESQKKVVQLLTGESARFNRTGKEKEARIYELAAMRAQQRLRELEATLKAQGEEIQRSQAQFSKNVRSTLEGDSSGKAA